MSLEVRVLSHSLGVLVAIEIFSGMPLPSSAANDFPPTSKARVESTAFLQEPEDQKAHSEGLFQSPRDVLKALGISESFWDSVQDGVPIQPEERELLLRLIFHVKMFQPAELEEWKQRPPEWEKVASNTRPFRGQLFEVKGKVSKATREPVPSEMAARLGFSHYYCSELEDESGVQYLIYSRTVPRAWEERESLAERTSVKGVFLKLAGSAPHFLPVLVTNRPSWYPDSLLGQLGMDCSLFDDVALESTDQHYVVPPPEKPGTLETEGDLLEKYRLTGRDRECFYQLLAAVGRARPGELLEVAKQELARSGRTSSSVVPLFNEAPRQQGKLFLLYGTARRIERVDVGDRDIQRRFGIDHYYTVYLFTEDSQNYPVVFCVRFLPRNVIPGEGPGYAVNLAVAGFFMKTWAFRPQASLAPDAPRQAWQLAPLLIGREAVLLAKPSAPQRVAQVTGILAGIVAALVGLIGLFVWWLNRQDRRKQEMIRQRLTPPLGPSSPPVESSEQRAD